MSFIKQCNILKQIKKYHEDNKLFIVKQKLNDLNESIEKKFQLEQKIRYYHNFRMNEQSKFYTNIIGSNTITLKKLNIIQYNFYKMKSKEQDMNLQLQHAIKITQDNQKQYVKSQQDYKYAIQDHLKIHELLSVLLLNNLKQEEYREDLELEESIQNKFLLFNKQDKYDY